MNKLKYLVFTIIISLLAIPFVSADSISIKSIELVEKSETTTINAEPTFSGLEMNYDLAFKNINDFAKYKIVIENNTNKEYKVTENTAFKVSEYVTYYYSSDQIIGANTTTDVMITIKYYKQIDETLIPEGQETYKETNKAVLEIKDENGAVVNPKTGIESPLVWLLILLVVSSISVFFIKKKQVTLAVITLILLLPSIIYAIEELKLIINVNVEIQRPDPIAKYKVSYIVDDELLYLTDEEVSKQDPTKITCDEPISYPNESTSIMYRRCFGEFVFEDEREYEAGETVQLKSISAIMNFTCGDRSQVCDDIRVAYINFNEWDYSLGASSEHRIEDKATMNFSHIDKDYWETSNYLYIVSPVTFTMPAHNVTFNEVVQK